MLQVIVIISCSLILNVWCYNLPPTPSNVIGLPENKNDDNALFGYSIMLRNNSILIGAPKGRLNDHSTLTGCVYNCSHSGYCSRYHRLHEYITTSMKELNMPMELEWFGVSMDGATNENSTFVVCSHRTIYDDQLENGTNSQLHGICYMVDNTISEEAEIRTIAFLEDNEMQYDNGLYFYAFGQQGISVHVNDQDDILIGAPGVKLGTGMVYINKVLENKKGGSSRSRRSPKAKRTAKLIIPNNASLYESFFGYSVATGRFLNDSKVYYVASSPKSSDYFGEVFIFQIHLPNIMSIRRTFNFGDEFHNAEIGTYFGYSLIVEDFNGDGFDDIAIGAPFYNCTGTHYNRGLVVVYINNAPKDNWGFFKTLLKPNSHASEHRFGMTLGKIGDINNDKFNDLAVGAPYEDASVYIYFGNPYGINDQPSQILKSPNGIRSFGMSISRGIDIDGNGFNDVAIGSPMEDKVYIYKSREVVKLLPRIILNEKKISIMKENFTFDICWKVEQLQDNATFAMKGIVIIDPHFERVIFKNNSKKLIEFERLTNSAEDCYTIDVKILPIRMTTLNESVSIEFITNLTRKYLANSELSCDDCYSVDQLTPNNTIDKVDLTKDCKGNDLMPDVCIPDLIVHSEWLGDKPFVMGSDNKTEIKYSISNVGVDPAYEATINISVLQSTGFSKFPSLCVLSNSNLICNLTSTTYLKQNESTEFLIQLDTQRVKLADKIIIVNATVSSSGIDMNPINNIASNNVSIVEKSEIEVSGKSSHEEIRLVDDDSNEILNVEHSFWIFNAGPSTLRFMSIRIYFPLSYYNSTEESFVSFIDKKSVSVILDYKNEKYENPLSGDKWKIAIPRDSRTKREVINVPTFPKRKQHSSHGDRTLHSISLHCSATVVSAHPGSCKLNVIEVRNLTKNEQLTMTLRFSLNLKQIAKIMHYSVNKTTIKITPELSINETEFNKIPYTEIINAIDEPIDILWPTVGSSGFGSIFLIGIAYFLKKIGFFKRKRAPKLVDSDEEDNKTASINEGLECDSIEEMTVDENNNVDTKSIKYENTLPTIMEVEPNNETEVVNNVAYSSVVLDTDLPLYHHSIIH